MDDMQPYMLFTIHFMYVYMYVHTYMIHTIFHAHIYMYT